MECGFALFAGTAPEVIRASAREAEQLGYSSFWVNHPGSTDGLVALALAAEETRRIELGIGVIPLHTRGPDNIVQCTRATALPLDRFLLGVGSSNPGALRRVRDGIAVLRSALPARLVVAALGPQMCRVAGEIADGVLFNWLTPEHARRSAEWVRAGAVAAGRRPPKLFAYVRLAVGTAARETLLREAGRYAAIPAYADHFARMGGKPVETAIAALSPDAIAPALGQWEGAVDQVVLRAITEQDTVGENVALLRAAKSA
jgi:alkanesulfonate monooxygenase SsuD/methylene tetrahydromethanopterin reductase-like flavin-dependent oxidoreductase (luciferase family)